MQSHFSILSASIRPEIQEQVAIGLMLVGQDNVNFRFSKNKIAVVKELMSQPAIKYLKDTLKQISSTVFQENEKFKGLYGGSDGFNKSFSLSYLEYLSRYSNNLLIFSKPKTIELQSSDDLFELLFKKYVDEYAFIEAISEPRSFDSNRTTFFNAVQPYFNIEQEVTPEIIPGLIMPVKVDLIGKNEIPVYAQTIDLERQNYHIQNDLAVLFMLNKALIKAKGFHISSEPDKKLFPHQHDTWKSIKDWNDSEYVDLAEVGKIEEYANLHGLVPLV
ncbi:MAG TPA: hypothetical protein VIK10_02870 [Prolixibacteraceae bacterium]